MNLAQVGLPGQRVDVLNGGDVHPDGHLLSIAEIRAALRALQAGDPDSHALARAQLRLAVNRPSGWRHDTAPEAGEPQQTSLFPTGLPAGPPAAEAHVDGSADNGAGIGADRDLAAGLAASAAVVAPRLRNEGLVPLSPPGITGGDTPLRSAVGRGDTATATPAERGDTPGTAPTCLAGPAALPTALPVRLLAIDPSWVVVIAAHSGAGATSVALLLADAVSAAGRPAHLLDTSRTCRSGLVAVPTRELGPLPGGLWRRGTRGRVTVDRPTGDTPPTGWPELTTTDQTEAGALLTVLDLGLPNEGQLSRLATAGSRTVIVARCTVPGVQAVEQQLTVLGPEQAFVALIGPGRWPSSVTSSAGQKLRALRHRGLVVSVGADRHLEATGLTSQPLPRHLIGAGRGLLAHLDQARPGPVIFGATGATVEGKH